MTNSSNTYKRPRCNCPDAVNSLNKNLYSSYTSETFDRNWDTNFTGIRDTGGYCIHELAVIMYRKELKQAYPQGIPYKPRMDSPKIFKEYEPQLVDSDFMFI